MKIKVVAEFELDMPQLKPENGWNHNNYPIVNKVDKMISAAGGYCDRVDWMEIPGES